MLLRVCLPEDEDRAYLVMLNYLFRVRRCHERAEMVMHIQTTVTTIRLLSGLMDTATY